MNKEDLLIFTSILLFAQGYLFVNVIPPLLGLSIILFLLGLRYSFNPLISCDVEILNKEVIENDEIRFIFKIKNMSKIPLKIRIFGSNDDFFWEVPSLLLNSGEYREAEVKLKPKKKGSFTIKEFILKVCDVYEIYSKDIFIKKEFTVNVYPSIDSIKKGVIRDKNIKLGMDALTSLKIGMRSLEFDSLREYQIGDDIKYIDWKATAKTGELIVREFLREHYGDLYILVDVSREFLKEITSKKSKVDYLSLLISQLAYFFTSKNINFEIIFFDNVKVKKTISNPKIEVIKNFIEELKPSKGIPSLKISFENKINLKFLKFVSPLLKGSISGITLASNKVKPNSSVIIITDIGLRGRELVGVINNLKKKNVKVYVLSLNPILFIDEDRLDEYNIPKLYRRYIEREELIKKITSLCPILDVGPGDLVDNMLEGIK
ncbi:DUF58 domain-containing protein [Methanocaldococcus sp. 16A]